jgi:hypothetical protein
MDREKFWGSIVYKDKDCFLIGWGGKQKMMLTKDNVGIFSDLSPSFHLLAFVIKFSTSETFFHIIVLLSKETLSQKLFLQFSLKYHWLKLNVMAIFCSKENRES